MKPIDTSAAALCTLGHRILGYASRGVLRTDFLQEVSNVLMGFSDCDRVALRVQEDDKRYECELVNRPHRQFRCKVAPDKPSDEETGPRSSSWTGDSGDPEYPSVAHIPLTVGDAVVGQLELASQKKSFFGPEHVEFYECVARILGDALVNRHARLALRERVKELTCLYGIAQLAEQDTKSLEDILQGIVELLPPAWLYPDSAQARIVLDDHACETKDFRAGEQRLSADIELDGVKRGVVEVSYSLEKPMSYEGPFLKEERNLIDTVVKQVGLIVERKQVAREKIRLEEQLRHADRLATIGQLASGAAHELNEPLGSVLGFAQLAMKNTGLPETVRHDLDRIVAASLHAREVIRKLLLFARQAPTRKERVNLNQIIKDGLYFTESRCSKEGVTLVRDLAPNLPEITADPSQMHQVVVNLAVNATQAMPNGGRLTIRTRREGDFVSLEVEDTGTGMSEEVKRRVFMPFFTTKEVSKGTGLGLSVVHGIVSAHGGTIEFESEVGCGTAFKIRLPLEGKSEEEKKG